ncbi:MAG: GTP-binding protein [Oscillospiraceae bacterium]
MDTNSNQARRVVIGITAHVDAGKDHPGRGHALPHRPRCGSWAGWTTADAAMDSHLLERERGITIFLSQAELPLGDMEVTLLDTPGHVDFSAEMERTLSVLDYAILVISGADGVQAHTRTLWRLLELYRVPTFLFVTKMDFGRRGRGADDGASAP